MSQRLFAVLLVALSALMFSTAGIFTQGVEADLGAVLFWRGLSAAAFAFVYLWLSKQLMIETGQWRRSTLWVTILMAIGAVAYFAALKLTSVTIVVVLWATAPFFSAFLMWLILGERPSWILILCSVAAFVGALMVSGIPSFSMEYLGEALMIVMNIVTALMILVYRKNPDTPSSLPTAISSVMVVLLACIWINPMDTALHEIIILLIFGVLFSAGTILFFEGAKRLNPVEVSLLSILEMPFAIILAVLILAEIIPRLSVFGVVIVTLAVIVSQYRILKN